MVVSTYRAYVLEVKRAPASELAEAVGEKTHHTVRFAGKTHEQANLARHIARLEILRSRGGPASEIVEAEKTLFLTQIFH